ncbi:MAG: peptidoglycan editing factor PgeF [Clostridia bacterium]|nr:peptidoglycan editing factor PgeF [Clostridia bacterium]
MTLPKTKTLSPRQVDGVLYYSFPLFDAIPFVRHGFSTRLGGVSEGTFASMNLSFTRGDDFAAVRENFDRFCAAIGVKSEDVVISAQTHTANVMIVTAEDRGQGITREKEYTDVDGLITNDPNVVLCTQYADCVPLFFVDPIKRVVATSHAGWRGTAAGIAAVTVDKMVEAFGCRREDILAGIGPSIGYCCFEVDTPVYDAFCQVPVFDDGCFTADPNNKFHINLQEVNRRWMLKAGLLAENITVTDLCTKCHPDVFWSHRITGDARGSLAAFIAIADK